MKNRRKKGLTNLIRYTLAGTLLSIFVLKIAVLIRKDHEYGRFNLDKHREMDLDKEEAREGKGSLYQIYIKRGIDVILSGMALIVSFPFFMILSVIIYIDDPGPILFTQKRIGIDKTYFKLHKFRSMKMSTPHDTPTHLLENPEQYITRVGKILRRYSLDELPQIWDIFIGNMSIVGPRPALWNQYDLIEERDRYHANNVRPGLTGWAQINGRDELEIAVKARYDGEYAEELRESSLKGFCMDCRCFLGTFLSVAKADGVVEGGTGEIIKAKEKTEPLQARKKLLAITNHSYMFWQFRRELMLELQKDYDVIISSPFVGHEKDLSDLGFRMIKTEVDRRGINPIKDLKLIIFYFKLLKKEKPSMVITYSIKPNIYAGLACRLLKIPYCVNVQGLGTAFQKKTLAFMVSWMYRISCKKAKRIFFENKGNAQIFIDRKIVPKEKVQILPGAGINLDYYKYIPYPKHDEVRFLYLGRIMKEKGIDELIYAIKRLHEEYGNKVVLDMVGFFEDEYEEVINNLVKEGIISFHGFQPDPRPYYANADCIVLPSYHEGMSNVLLEAAATGRCIVTSDIPGCKEAVEDGNTGLLHNVKDKYSLYTSMRKICEMSREVRESMGKQGRKRMEKIFDKNMVISKTKDLIQGVV